MDYVKQLEDRIDELTDKYASIEKFINHYRCFKYSLFCNLDNKGRFSKSEFFVSYDQDRYQKFSFTLGTMAKEKKNWIVRTNNGFVKSNNITVIDLNPSQIIECINCFIEEMCFHTVINVIPFELYLLNAGEVDILINEFNYPIKNFPEEFNIKLKDKEWKLGKDSILYKRKPLV